MNWLLCLLGFHDWSPPSVLRSESGLYPPEARRYCRNHHCSRPSQTLSADGKRWK